MTAAGDYRSPRWRTQRASNGHTPTANRRAVSDVIGFSLMFGIIIVGVAVVSVAGLGDVLDFGDREELSSGERSMEAAAATLDKLNSQGDMNRSFSMVVGTGNIWLNESELTVTGPPEIGDNIGDGGTIQVNSLEHRFSRSPEDVSLAYEAGAVYRSDAALARYRPSIKCNTEGNTALISLVNITDRGSGINVAVDFSRQIRIDPTSIPDQSPVAAFAATLTLQADLVDTETVTVANAGQVDLDVSRSANPEQWAVYLESTGWEEETTGIFRCDADDVAVQVTTVAFRRLV